MLIKIIVSLLFSTIVAVSAIQINTKIDPLYIEGNINEHIQVKFPFDEVVEVKIKNDSIPGYVQMIENRFKLITLKSVEMLSKNNKTVLEELRSPFSQSSAMLFDLNRSLITFDEPNKFKVITQDFMNSYKVRKEYEFKEMKGNKPEISVIESNFVMIVLSKSKIILFNETHNFTQDNPFNKTGRIYLRKILSDDDILFMTILDHKVHFCTIQNGVLQIQCTYPLTNNEKDLKVDAFERGKLFKGGQQIWMVDQDQGLFLMVVNDQLKLVSHPVQVEKIKGCYDLDIKVDNHNIWVLLTCKESDSSTFKVFFYDNDSPTYPFILKKVEPYIEKCLADKFFFFQDYIFSMEDNSLDIFIPASEQKGKIVYDKFWVSLDMNSYVMQEDYKKERIFIQGVNNAIVAKKQLLLENYTLMLMTPEPVNEIIALQVDFLCTRGVNGPKQVCSTQVILDLNIHDNLVSYVRWKSFNIGFALLLCTSLIALFLLCRYKYKSIYHRAYQNLKEITNPDKCEI